MLSFRAGLRACSEIPEASKSRHWVLGPPGQGANRFSYWVLTQFWSWFCSLVSWGQLSCQQNSCHLGYLYSINKSYLAMIYFPLQYVLQIPGSHGRLTGAKQRHTVLGALVLPSDLSCFTPAETHLQCNSDLSAPLRGENQAFSSWWFYEFSFKRLAIKIWCFLLSCSVVKGNKPPSSPFPGSTTCRMDRHWDKPGTGGLHLFLHL